MQRIPFDEMHQTFLRILGELGFDPERAALCARTFAESTRDGIASHGVNAFANFVNEVRAGANIEPHARPRKLKALGPFEQWDGRRGPGISNAHAGMERAIELAREHGMGCVALRNTNHWLRGGSYGLQAVDAGCLGLCWTNAPRSMPPWGSSEPRLGNNPLVVAIPGPDGPILLDMALSQFSNGRKAIYRRRGEALPVEGGYDARGQLTRDPQAITDSGRPLPIGYWKGSGLALVLDLAAALLSGGESTAAFGRERGRFAQVFLAFALDATAGRDFLERTVAPALADLHGATPVEGLGGVMYPGERMLRTRRESLEQGIPVEPEIWDRVRQL